MRIALGLGTVPARGGRDALGVIPARGVLLALGVVVALAGARARADGLDPGVALDRFAPAPGPGGFLGVAGAEPPRAFSATASPSFVTGLLSVQHRLPGRTVAP